jgi:sporulation protein YlmC with PRC-barrel domain
MGEHRVSNLMKSTVKNAGGESVGTINDALFDRTGQVTHYIIGGGGFLGIGERNVAIPFDNMRISRDANNAVVVATTTPKETLSQLPEWKDPATAVRAPASSPPARTAPTTPKDQPSK